jgi:hypothetical protein
MTTPAQGGGAAPAAAGGTPQVKVKAPIAFELSEGYKEAANLPHGEARFKQDVKAQFSDMNFIDDENCVEKKGQNFEFQGTFRSGPEADWIRAHKGRTVRIENMRIVIRDPAKLGNAMEVANILQEAPFTMFKYLAGGASYGAPYGKNDTSKPYYFMFANPDDLAMLE